MWVGRPLFIGNLVDDLLEDQVIVGVDIQAFGVYIDHFNQILPVLGLLCDFLILLVIYYSAALALPKELILVVQNCFNHFVETELVSKKHCFEFLLGEKSIAKLHIVTMT